MRILFLFDGLHRGGRERRFVQLIKGLNEKGYTDLYMISSLDSITYEEIYNYHINISIISRKEKNFYSRLIKRINEISPEIIQTWSLVSTCYYDAVRFLCKKRPVYINSFISDCNYQKLSLFERVNVRTSYLLSNTITANCKAGLIQYKVPKSKAFCLYNGFDMDRLNTVYDEDCIKKKYCISTKYVISMFARMQYHKDYRTFLNTASRIIKDGYDVTFLCVGGGALLNKNMAIVNPSERKNIIFTGQVKNVDELMSVSDVSVLCTNANAHQEGISNSILESMAFGVPVIATTGGGTNEIVIDGYNGYLISPKDEDALYKKILDLLNNEHLRVEISNNAKKHIIDNFTLERSTKQYIELYKSVLKIV